MLKKYPLAHPDCEKESLHQCPSEIRMSAKWEDTRISDFHIDQSLLGDFCISRSEKLGSGSDIWPLNDIDLNPCRHEMPR